MDEITKAAPTLEPVKQIVDKEQAHKWADLLGKYRAGKTALEVRVTQAEKWWKLRNQYEEQTRIGRQDSGLKSGSAWLHNVIVNKHADAIEAYPQPNILAREEGDKVEAWALSEIIPCVLEQNHFEETYSDVQWQKCKTGTGVYKIVWDPTVNNIGDIVIKRVDLLNLYWEPGIEDIQDSKYIFHTEWFYKTDLKEMYPQLEDKDLQSVVVPKKMPTDDNISDDGKVIVVDVYYKKNGILQYAKFVGETILYATENDPERAQTGLYNHQLYPYVFDVLFPQEDSPAGYGYIDINCNSQTRIDMMNAALLRNTIAGSMPRYFERADSAINEEEFLDLNNTIVHVANGTLDEQDIKQIEPTYLQATHLKYYNQTIQELRETSGNNDAATGSAPASVTSASGIAALQEAAQRGSRSAILGTYRAYSLVINQVIELIRQFYDLPRQFRITGQLGIQKYITFTNQGMQPQPQGLLGGVDMGFRLPVYDIKVEPQKRSKYTQVAQNELAKELYGLGLFQPENVNQALLLLNIMDFPGREELMQKLAQQGSMYQTLLQWQQFGLTMAQAFRPDLVQGLSEKITGERMGTAPQIGNPNPNDRLNRMNSNDGTVSNNYKDKNSDGQSEHPFVEKARKNANSASEPTGSRVMT